MAMCVVLASPGRAADEFTRALAPGEFDSAGLSKLTPGELVRLDALVRRFKFPNQPGKSVSERAPGAKPPKSRPAWIEALITLERSGTAPEKAEAFESHLAGNFNGWTGRSTFRLEDGQLWAQANSESYDYSPTLHSPKVKITPASFGSFWMEIEGVNQRCRVKPVKLN